MDTNKISADESGKKRADKKKKVDALFTQLEGLAVNKINRLEATNCYLERRLARLEAVLLSAEDKVERAKNNAFELVDEPESPATQEQAADTSQVVSKPATVALAEFQQLAATATIEETNTPIEPEPPVLEENISAAELEDSAKIENQQTQSIEQLTPKQRLNLWLKAYPAAFTLNEPKPLKIGIHKDLQQAEDLTEKLVKRVLANYVKLPRYLNSIKADADRVDLNGQVCGQVTAEEETFAQEQLKRLGQLKKSKLNKQRQEVNRAKQPARKSAQKPIEGTTSQTAQDMDRAKKQTNRNSAPKPRPNNPKPLANKQRNNSKKSQNTHTNKVANTAMQDQLQKLLG